MNRDNRYLSEHATNNEDQMTEHEQRPVNCPHCGATYHWTEKTGEDGPVWLRFCFWCEQ